MKSRILIIALGLAMSAFPLSSFAQDVVKMPVMRVTMSQPPTRNMEYCTGSFELTDAAGNVTTSYAKFKTRGATHCL